MLHARTARFDVTGTVALFGKTFRELNKGLVKSHGGLSIDPILFTKMATKMHFIHHSTSFIQVYNMISHEMWDDS